jgi:hypothetical protein
MIIPVDDDADGGDDYETFWRVVRVNTLPFPFHLFRCPFVGTHLRALEAAGADPDSYATPEQCSQAFRVFVTDTASKLTTCPYHQPNWNLAAAKASTAARGAPTEAKSRIRPDTTGLDHETAWAAWSLVAEPLWINGDRLGNGQHRVCAMKCADVLEIPIEEIRSRRRQT